MQVNVTRNYTNLNFEHPYFLSFYVTFHNKTINKPDLAQTQKHTIFF